MDFIFIDVKDTFSLGDKMQNKIVTDARSEFVVLGAIFVAVKIKGYINWCRFGILKRLT